MPGNVRVHCLDTPNERGDTGIGIHNVVDQGFQKKVQSLRKYEILYNPEIAFVVSSFTHQRRVHVSLLAFFFLTCFGDSQLSSAFS